MKAFIAFLLALLCSSGFAADEKFCNWDHPGTNKYQNLPVEALKDYYMDYRVRATLQVKMINHWYDDIVEIRRDGVSGYQNMRDMHYGKGRYCPGPVDTSQWGRDHVERGLVYCVAEVCVIVPTVCNNVSLIDRMGGGSSEEGPTSLDAGEIQPTPLLASAGEIPPAPDVGSSEVGGDEGGGYLLGGPSGSPGGYGGGLAGGPGIGFEGPPGSSYPVPPGCNCTPPPSGPPVCPPPISAVPETPEWIMMIAGLACFVWCWSRRQR